MAIVPQPRDIEDLVDTLKGYVGFWDEPIVFQVGDQELVIDSIEEDEGRDSRSDEAKERDPRKRGTVIITLRPVAPPPTIAELFQAEVTALRENVKELAQKEREALLTANEAARHAHAARRELERTLAKLTPASDARSESED